VEEEELSLLKEQIRPRNRVPILLQRLHERAPEPVEYIGTSYGLTADLLKFWKSADFVPLYLSQKANELTAEHTCIMLHVLNLQEHKWLPLYYQDFRRRVLKLMGKTFREFDTKLCLSLLKSKSVGDVKCQLDKQTLDAFFLPHDLQRLESYARSQVEFRVILDLLSDIALLYFQGRIEELKLDTVQKATLLALGIQGKTVDTLGLELNMPGNQLLAKFYDAMRKCNHCVVAALQEHYSANLKEDAELDRGEKLQPLEISLDKELDKTAKKISKKQDEELRLLIEEAKKEDEENRLLR